MAVRTVRQVGDPVLKKKSKEIKELTERYITLINDMKETMEFENGIGIAAVQIGILRRVFIAYISGKIHVFINPEIYDRKGTQSGVEGCLSIKGKFGIVERPKELRIKYMDEDWKEQTLYLKDKDAKVVSHEFDHLEGILYTDIAIAVNPSEEEIKKIISEREDYIDYEEDEEDKNWK